ncbi:MAG: hypothetical protein IT177_22020 [Acidobacteria bacterium]|nr:hypothetical protein [Acidobacteriota bacterium]
MQKLFTVGVALALVASVACGKSEAEKQAEQAAAEMEKAAKAAEAAGQDVAKGMEEFGKAMSGLAGAMGGDGKTVDPVSFQALETTLPQVSGWERGKPESERMTSPFAYSQTEATYTKGDARIDVKVVDSGFAQMLIAPWSMMLASGYSRESSDGYEKAVTVNGQPGFEKWDSSSKNGELNVLVDKRFLVSFEGSDLADTRVLHEMAGKMDFGTFVSLK